MNNDPWFHLCQVARSRLNCILKHNVIRKDRKSFEYIGCTSQFLRWWIESQFQPGMTWDNLGRGKDCWHIDHEYPLTLVDPHDERTLVYFRWTNLRPMWEADNFAKSDKIPDPNYDI